MPRKRGLYRGYSSFEFQANKTFKVNDVNLVKLDLLNHIFTRRGERVMMPTFGTSIPLMVFEPLDDVTIESVRSDLLDVFEFDPRVDLLELAVVPDIDNHLIGVSARLFYVELAVTDDMEFNIQFNT